MKILLLACFVCVAVSQLVIPDNSLVRHVVDGGFSLFDKYPTDGSITHNELDKGMLIYDTNNDGCVTEAEFEHINNIPIPHITATFYDHFDKDHNDCLTADDLAHTMRDMDTSGDGTVSLPEFESYFIKLITDILVEMFPITGIFG